MDGDGPDGDGPDAAESEVDDDAPDPDGDGPDAAESEVDDDAPGPDGPGARPADGRRGPAADTTGGSGRPCPLCGTGMARRHCKYVCPNHGVVYDCSDTFW